LSCATPWWSSPSSHYSARHALLKLLDQRLLELADLSTTQTDDVVVVLVAHVELEPRAFIVGEVVLLQEAGFDQHAERPVNRR
jgi:hypothetical protein